ncbi:hypothetical protein C0216_27325 [Streptomyces globosus]|uniref:Type II toxin-antitoxin system RelE/ParE family toxin n=1 Tax=Streptomyces globosus TaxID=68209 RepID=A0A344U6Y7_9ACTN|nr:hypothetical protein C0216_27325 [Streptomyces globosus]
MTPGTPFPCEELHELFGAPPGKAEPERPEHPQHARSQGPSAFDPTAAPLARGGDVQKITGPSGLYRLRVGNHRVAYQVDDGELVILVVKAGDRRDVYRNL